MSYAHTIPAVYLLFEMLMNKIQIEIRQVFHYIGLVIVYLGFTMLYEYLNLTSVYFDNLNWFCFGNVSYLFFQKKDKAGNLVKNQSGIIYRQPYNSTCADWNNKSINVTQKVILKKYISRYECLDIKKSFFCPSATTNKKTVFTFRKNDTTRNTTLHEKNMWKNGGFMITEMFLIGVLFFILSVLIHYLKAIGSKPHHS